MIFDENLRASPRAHAAFKNVDNTVARVGIKRRKMIRPTQCSDCVGLILWQGCDFSVFLFLQISVQYDIMSVIRRHDMPIHEVIL